jgi:hypothetical protein
MHLIAFCVVAFVNFTFPFTSTFCVFSQSVTMQFLRQMYIYIYIYIYDKNKTDLVQSIYILKQMP